MWEPIYTCILATSSQQYTRKRLGLGREVSSQATPLNLITLTAVVMEPSWRPLAWW
jgi:hypothetical protein